MKEFGARSLENETEEIPMLDAEFDRLKGIIGVLKNMGFTVIADSVVKEDLMEPDFDIALIKEGSEGMHVSFNSKTGLCIHFVNEWVDLNNPKNITPHRIKDQVKKQGLDKLRIKPQKSANYMA
jgi:hypothetical protein